MTHTVALRYWIILMTFEQLWDETLIRIDPAMGQQWIAVGKVKGKLLQRLAMVAALIPGDMAEVGAWTGGSARIIAKTVPEKKLRVFDTFNGMKQVFNPELDGASFEKEFSEDVFDIAIRALSDCRNVEIFRGLFPDTANELGETGYAFIHADADVHKSTHDICEWFYPRMSVGGIIVFDDYGYKGAPGCKKAVDDYFQSKPEAPSVLSTGQAVVIKTYEA